MRSVLLSRYIELSLTYRYLLDLVFVTSFLQRYRQNSKGGGPSITGAIKPELDEEELEYEPDKLNDQLDVSSPCSQSPASHPTIDVVPAHLSLYRLERHVRGR